MATTGDILSVLLNEDKNSDGFPEFLRGFLQSEEYPTFTSALEGHEKVEFLEFLDKGSELFRYFPVLLSDICNETFL